MQNLLKHIIRLKIEYAIFAVVVVIGAIFSWYIYDIGLTKILVDQNSHLNIARQITDSITPGMSQVGLWPPLLHFLMAPASAINPLFHSGLAGAAVLVPLLGLASVMLYKLIRLLTAGVLLGIFGVVLFVSNPYILYYAVTPMTELLFISTLIGVAYFMALWFKSEKITHLIVAALFIVAASLARFEGFVLIPIVAVIVFFHLRGNKKSRDEIEAVLVLFGTVAMLGIGYTLAYGWTFAGDALAFMNGTWSAGAQQQDYLLPTQYNLTNSFKYLFFASTYMIGFYQIILSVLGFLFALLIVRGSKEFRRTLFMTGAILASPFIFDLFALFQGSVVLYVPNLPPYDSFFNERYGLYSFAFIAFAPLALAAVLTGMQARTKLQKNLQSLGRLAGSALLTVLVLTNILFLHRVAFVDKFLVVRESAQGFLAVDQGQLASALSDEYDDGNIFITRALQNFVTVDAKINLKNYIHESNYPYYDQTLERPWLFAKWVVMYNPDIQVTQWRKQNELISVRWGNSQEFARAYELVYENDSERLYRLRSDVIYLAAVEQGIDVDAIPSLNPEIVRWNPGTVYDEMMGPSDSADLLAGSPDSPDGKPGSISQVHAEEPSAAKSIFF